MDEKGFAVVIKVQWDGVEERIRLDYSPEGALEAVYSSEDWKDVVGVVQYTPRSRSVVGDGRQYSVELEYVHDDHARLCDGVLDKVYWGTTQLSFRFVDGKPTMSEKDVYWKGNGSYSEDLNGPPGSVSIERVEPSKLKDASVKVRLGQKSFKEKLRGLEKQPCCAISGEMMEELLDAVHIIAVADGGSDEVENGLLLRADIHRLFDAGIFEINLDGSLKMKHSGKLSKSYRDSFKAWSTQKISEDVMRRIGNSLKKKKQMSKPSPEQVTV